MVDVVTRDVRSRMMSGIRGKNTRPEKILRSGLHRLGYRFRLHDQRLPGKPDLVFPKYSAVLFAHGCFWHGHDCRLFKWPSTRSKFWRDKITRNQEIDAEALTNLAQEGWRVGIVWECALKGRDRLSVESVLQRCSAWVRSDSKKFVLRGQNGRGSSRI
jgi:DNA mismatch endonuclease, patch repair protein